MTVESSQTRCPYCGAKAIGEIEIDDIFGYRKVSDNKVIPQSYCRKCRSSKR